MKAFYLVLISTLLITPAFCIENVASVAELFGTPENLRLVRNADKVDACLLHHVQAATRPDGSVDRSPERYDETTFVSVPPETAATLRDLLLNRKTYDWKASNGGRRPQFYLRLRFHRGGELIDLDFCFMCHVVHLTRSGEEVGHANFSPNSDLILQALRHVFPNDEPLKQVAKEAGLPL
ncbi:MAG TPA: hypothetical protein VGM64_04995 [Lacunisphaera sp.]|jgi:hypothetical protein